MKKRAEKSMVMNENHIEIIVDDERWNAQLEEVESWGKEVFFAAVEYLSDKNMGFDGWAGKGISVNLALSSDDEIQRLNVEFRGKNKPTNVLSFARIDDESFYDDIAKQDVVELGDIIIALETLVRESQEKSINLKDHFAHLLVHGILHLFGYDHIEDDEAEEMEAIEIDILEVLNVNNPYEYL